MGLPGRSPQRQKLRQSSNASLGWHAASPPLLPRVIGIPSSVFLLSAPPVPSLEHGPPAHAQGKSVSPKRPPTPPQWPRDLTLNKAQPRENCRDLTPIQTSCRAATPLMPQESVPHPQWPRWGSKRAAAFAIPFPRYLFLQDRDGRAPDESDHLINPLGKERANCLDSQADGTHEFLHHALQVRFHAPAAAQLRRALHCGCQERKLWVARWTGSCSTPRHVPRRAALHEAQSHPWGSGSGRKRHLRSPTHSPSLLHPNSPQLLVGSSQTDTIQASTS